MVEQRSFIDAFAGDVRPLLDRYDQIRDLLSLESDLDAASIVVIGDQSSGKSSVLESLVQVDLPRGENIVTRAPIILQCRSLRDIYGDHELARVSTGSPSSSDSEVIGDFHLLEKAIREKQDSLLRSADSANSISETPIYVQVVKAGIPDVTLIDLPGINYNNETIRAQISSLYRKYTAGENVIILNVISALTDVQANESVLYAKKVDPEETRTIYVFTKIDKIESEELLRKAESVPRCVFVRNRSPKELKEGLSWGQVRRLEHDLLSEYDVTGDSRGVPALSHILVEESQRLVQASIKHLMNKVPQRIIDLKKQIADLGEPCESHEQKKDAFDSICRRMRSRLENLYNRCRDKSDTLEHCYAVVVDRLLENFASSLQVDQFRLLSGEKHEQVKEALRVARSAQLPNFLSHPCFRELLRDMIHQVDLQKTIEDDMAFGKYESGTDKCSGIVEYMMFLMTHLLNECLGTRRGNEELRDALLSDMEEEITGLARKVTSVLSSIVEAELTIGPVISGEEYEMTLTRVRVAIDEFDKNQLPNWQLVDPSSHNVHNQEFEISLDEKTRVSVDVAVYQWLQEREDKRVFEMQLSLFCYWRIFSRRVVDTTFLMVKRGICYELTQFDNLARNIWRRNSTLYLGLLEENKQTVQLRTKLSERLHNLQQIASIMSEMHI